MRKSGFTLAEVLVTLGIIGVVAALTMPQMTARTQNMQLETATLKYYSQIQEALQRYMVQNGIDELDASFSGSDFVEKSFKTTLKCDRGHVCYADNYKTLTGGEYDKDSLVNGSMPAYTLNGGAALQVRGVDAPITVDINGVKGPNMLNRDTWILYLRKDGSVVDYLQESTPAAIDTNLASCKAGSSNYGCFAHFVKNGFKFDY